MTSLPVTPTILTQPGSVAVIAARGRMGAMLMHEGRLAGLGMAGFSRPFDWEAMAEDLKKAAVVIVCVPAASFLETVKAVCPLMRKDAILADITSVKVNPMKQMESVWQGGIVGTHPLFGPLLDRSQDLPVALVRGKNCPDEAVQLVAQLFEAMDFSTFETDADTHDMAMARIQNMNFITSLAYFAQLAGQKELMPYLTPSFRRRMDSARKMLTEDGPMFAGFYEANPYSQEAVRQFSKFLSLASAGDIDLLLSRASWWWKDQKHS